MRHFILTVGFLCVVLLGQSSASAAPSTVDTSSSGQATASSSQRKTFFDTVNDVHWAFYYNGAAIEYSYSSDGEGWTSAGTLAYNTSNFSVVFKSISGTSYAFLVAEANTYDIVLRRGVLGASSVVFDAEQTVFNGTSISDRYAMPTVAISENSHLWVSGIKDHGLSIVERFHVSVRRSTNLADGDLSAFDATAAVGRRIATLKSAVILPRNGNEMYLISSADDTNIIGYTFDGSSWSDANTGNNYSWFSFGSSGFNQQVHAIVVSGSDIYVGGQFTNAGGIAAADRIARWDGTKWNALGAGLTNVVYAIAVIGSDIYAGGEFHNAGGIEDADGIARWDGANWNALGSGSNLPVFRLAVSGSDLFVGGRFTDIEGIAEADSIARWDGSNWHALGNGLNDSVYALVSSGSDLYVGGGFTDAGGIVEADGIAKWDGSAWSAIGVGLNDSVHAIAISGTDIYVGGAFTDAGGIADADRVAKWDGSNWSALGVFGSAINQVVGAIAIAGSDVYVGGYFTDVDGVNAADHIARWDGSNWNAVDDGLNGPVNVLTFSGGELYIGGSFYKVGSLAGVNDLVRWDGAAWGNFDKGGLGRTAQTILISGNDIYVGGGISDAGGVVAADRIAKWDGNSWTALGPGLNGYVYAMLVSGGDLYVGGAFTDAGGDADADYVARWDGNNWNALGGGIVGTVHALEILGGSVYVGGEFTDADGIADADYVARWDGANWHALGTGSLSGGFESGVRALAVSGSDLYVGGRFSDAGGIAEADNIARWDGTNWNSLGGAGLDAEVNDLAVSGSDVYAAGGFRNAGGIAPADRIARWDGSAWNALGGGLSSVVNAIAISGSDIYAAGIFADAGGVATADKIARWDGNAWNAIGSGLAVTPFDIAVSGDKVYVTGQDLTFDGLLVSGLAFYGPAIASDAGATTEISPTADSDGNIYLTYTSTAGNLRFRRYDDTDESWDDSVLLNNAVSTSPSLSYRSSSGGVTASWIEAGAVKFSHALAPYESSNWTSEETVYSTGTNSAVSSAATQETLDLQLFWTNGTANPFNLLTDDIEMNVAPTVAITSTEVAPTNTNQIPITVTFSADVTGFTINDLLVTNGTKSNFVAVDQATYSFDIAPAATGLVTVNISSGVATDFFANNNSAATQFSIAYDETAPTVVISSTASTPTSVSPIPLNIEFGEAVTGFAAGDIVVTNGVLSNFVAVDGNSYTARITPVNDGLVSANIAAGVAQDTASNSNSAATRFSIRYQSLDSDGDGVSDAREASDGTNPNDSGSAMAELPTKWCSDWNGFLGMYNINEYVNLTNKRRTVVATLFDITGEAKSSLGIDLMAGTQTDLLVHDMPQWTKDSYGKVCSEVSGAKPGEVDGRMIYYKPSLFSADYEFAFALPYYDGLSGKQFLAYNNLQPSLDAADASNLIANWVQLANLEETEQEGTLVFYRQDGTEISRQLLMLAAQARQDFAVHDIAPKMVGTIQWKPKTNSAKFALRNTRYYYDNPGTLNSFSAALQLEAVKGSGELLSVPLDARSQTAVLEVANTTASAVMAIVRIYDATGVLKDRKFITVAPHASHHIVANQHLNEELGSATVDGSSIGSLIAVGMHYGRTSSGGISHIYGIIAKQPLGDTTKGSYNTYLGQSCELQLVNASNGSVTSTIEMTRFDGTEVLAEHSITIPAKGTSSFDICSQEEPNNYGVVTVVSDEKNAIMPLIIRSGANGSYRFVTPVR